MSYLLHLLILLDIYVVVALSLNIIFGYCGLLSLAHAGYFAIGAYAYALAVLVLGWGFIPAVLLGMALSSVLSIPLTLASWRFRGDFFVLITLSLQSTMYSVAFNWWGAADKFGTLGNITNGAFGIMSISKPVILGFEFNTLGRIALLFSTIALVSLGFSWRLLASPWGRLLKALRDDELAARSLGKNVRLAKAQAIAISCAMVSLAGAMYASYLTFIDPAIANLSEAILMISMVVVGGVGNSFRGPLVGVLVLLAIPELLRLAKFSDTAVGEQQLAAYGLLLVLLMHFRPQGLAGEYKME